MCGILGVVGLKFPAEKFKDALDRLAHRGPDGEGIWKSPGGEVVFGHRRLSIIDLSDAAAQPFLSDDLVLTFNGEIYNYIEIRKELEGFGFRFSTQSDTEVLINSYRHWGPSCVKKFNGMWAFAIYEPAQNRIFFSRDRFGKKPLFYIRNSQGLVFGSEMKALAPFLPKVEPNPNFISMAGNAFGYESGSECLVNNILRFPAGSNGWYSIKNNSLKIEKYWDTLQELIEVPPTYEEQVECYREIFLDAVKIRMRSDVPVGTALSGGLDSSAVAGAMAFLGKSAGSTQKLDWQNAFIASFPDTFLDETEYARKVVNHLSINGNFISIDQAEGIENLGKYLYAFEEIDYTSPIPMSRVYEEMAKKGVRVSLDGHGVDEAMSGYGKSLFEIFLDTCSPRAIHQVLTTYRGLHPPELLPDGGKSNASHYLSYLFTRKKTLFRNLVNAVIPVKNGPIEKLGNFNYNLYLLFHDSILPTLLRNYDRYAMMSSVEIRMPFMDYRLVRFAFSLPWQSKVKNGFTKAIVRDAVKEFLPTEVVFRKSKIGFQTPIGNYLKGGWRQYFYDEMESIDFKNCNLIDSAKVSKLFNEFQASNQIDHNMARKFWHAVVPYLWEKHFLNKIK
jgi:asparagine synthase (glutamine-hydrolysing)